MGITADLLRPERILQYKTVKLLNMSVLKAVSKPARQRMGITADLLELETVLECKTILKPFQICFTTRAAADGDHGGPAPA